MDYYKKHELKKISPNTEEYALVIHLDSQFTEFAEELGTKPRTKENIKKTALLLISKKYPGIRITVVNVMMGGMIVSSLPLLTNPQSVSAQGNTTATQTTQASAIYYHVLPGDTLWSLSKTFNTSVDFIKKGNSLKSDTLQLNQKLIIPKAFHTVAVGDYLSVLARDYNSSVAAIREANNLTSDNVRLGQLLLIPVLVNQKGSSSSPAPTQPPAQEETKTYTVVSGDSLSVIAKRFGVSLETIRSANNLSSDVIRVGQNLIIPSGNLTSTTPEKPINNPVHTVIAGESLSVIAKHYGVTVDALRTTNNLKSDILQLGQILILPKNNGNSTPVPDPTPEPVQTPKPTPEPAPAQPNTTYTVVAGDNLWKIAQLLGTTIDALRSTNNLQTDNLQIGQTLIIPTGGEQVTPSQPVAPPTSKPTPEPIPVQPITTTYTVVAGDNLWKIAQLLGTTIDALRSTNNLQTDNLHIGQALIIPIAGEQIAPSQPTIPSELKISTFTYRVISGDTLSLIANRFGVTVDSIRSVNNLKSDVLQIGQALVIQEGKNAPAQTNSNTLTFTSYRVVSGDTLWGLSVRYGLPQSELMRANNLTNSSVLTIGQMLTIPVHHIAVKSTVSEKHGELLDWWTEAQYVFSIGKTAKVTDFATGKSFYIKRTIGANHADSETVSVIDTEIAKSIWGGFSWTPRAVIVEVDGRKLAGSMSFMPHDVEYIANNGITGHFDVYFSNSTRHKDGMPDPTHQLQVERAAGIR
ncbi:LysM peptidoglycan-binding domain-containing protein [Sutcliffiella halmapala]|uniref:LysM peptidoglycan-binding domain-containing protein n=1 Tax=Sutcliffiella halmapala TaxID=79882 RepID=UPI0009951842|nr:LysM peptidoglycan-binding domain-containing protein [Sutcliffiella halmapala]